MSKRLRVVVIDDHPVFREGTAALLSQETDIEIVGVGATLEDANRMLGGQDPPDVLLLDIRLGEESGLRLLERPATHTAVVIFSAYDYPQYVRAALAAGAAGFVSKSDPTSELVGAIRRAAVGELAFKRRAQGPAVDFTHRELDVLRRVVDGYGNDEIAQQLGISSKTVEAHLGRMFARVSVRSRTELAIRAVREGWLDLPHTS